jgi:hypothetical protein
MKPVLGNRPDTKNKNLRFPYFHVCWHHFFNSTVKNVMKRLLYLLAVLTLAGWILGFFMLNAGTFIHLLVILAILLWLQAVIINPKPQAHRRVV